MNISSDKQARSHTKKLEHGSETVTLKENLNLLTAAQDNAIRTN